MSQKVLIIDGHPVYANKTIEFLQSLGFTHIYLATTGQQGIDTAKLRKPDLVIISSMLPDIDSTDLCWRIKTLARDSVNIIVQIGLFTEDETIALFKANGAGAVLMRKEKDLTPLKKAIDQLLLTKA